LNTLFNTLIAGSFRVPQFHPLGIMKGGREGADCDLP
jgi:hypothetical protein